VNWKELESAINTFRRKHSIPKSDTRSVSIHIEPGWAVDDLTILGTENEIQVWTPGASPHSRSRT
jgi:hypothetical protein